MESLSYYYERKVPHESGLHTDTLCQPYLSVWTFSSVTGTDMDNEKVSVTLVGSNKQLGRHTSV